MRYGTDPYEPWGHREPWQIARHLPAWWLAPWLSVVISLAAIAITFGAIHAADHPNPHHHTEALPVGVRELSPSEYWTPNSFSSPGDLCGDYYDSIEPGNGGWVVECPNGQKWSQPREHGWTGPWADYGLYGGAALFTLALATSYDKRRRIALSNRMRRKAELDADTRRREKDLGIRQL